MLIRTPDKPARIIELEDEGQFAAVVHQAEALRRNSRRPGTDPRQRVRIVIRGSNNRKRWEDLMVWSDSYWEPQSYRQMPRPTKQELAELVRPYGFRFGEAVVRTTI